MILITAAIAFVLYLIGGGRKVCQDVDKAEAKKEARLAQERERAARVAARKAKAKAASQGSSF